MQTYICLSVSLSLYLSLCQFIYLYTSVYRYTCQRTQLYRQAVDISAPEDVSSIRPMAEELNKLIDKEISLGIDVKRIVVGLYSYISQ